MNPRYGDEPLERPTVCSVGTGCRLILTGANANDTIPGFPQICEVGTVGRSGLDGTTESRNGLGPRDQHIAIAQGSKFWVSKHSCIFSTVVHESK